jgi:hypothetical protein
MRRAITIPAEHLVRGSVALLGPGERVEADRGIIHVKGVPRQEAALLAMDRFLQRAAGVVSGDRKAAVSAARETECGTE